MDDNQFTQMLSYSMLTALNTAGIFQQNQRMRPLTVEEIGQLQTDLLQTAQALGCKLRLDDAFDWPPAYGHSDT